MKLKSFLLSLLAVIFISAVSYAQPQGNLSYNFTRAIEEFKKGNKAEAMDYLTKELNDNPDNGYAHMTVALLQTDAENYSEAMKSINIAIRKLPKKDKEFTGQAYACRAHLYGITGDTVEALADYNRAVSLNPEDEDLQETLGQALYELSRYDEADAVYRKIISINPAGVTGYMGLGRNAYARENYEEAIRQYDNVLKMYDEYSSGYAFRGESYMKLGKYLEAVNDFIKALSIDSDAKAYYYLFTFPADRMPLVISKLKAMTVKKPHDAEWWFYLGQIYHVNKKYAEAVDAYRKVFDIDGNPDILDLISECYSETGNYAKALEYINQAVDMDPDNIDLISTKADILGDSGDVEGAIAEWTEYIERNPDYWGGYYRRGFFEDNSGRLDAALDDYDMAIMLMPDYAYSYLGKGDVLMLKGKTDEAMEAYRKVVELDTVPDNNSCAMYALLALGEKDKAIAFMDRVIQNDTTDSGNYYNAACLYSKMGDTTKSLANLRIAFEKGFRRFHHVKADDDLEQVRLTEGFRELMEEYELKAREEIIPLDSEATEEVDETVEVPFTPDGGCVSVRCSINELPLNFIFDTGASTVSLSQVEANFMFKNGYLKPDDIIGSGRFVDANGDVSEGTLVNLRNVDFGGLKLSNVRASVVRNQRAPLLLGQSVLGRLGSIEIDNASKKLIIKRKNK